MTPEACRIMRAELSHEPGLSIDPARLAILVADRLKSTGDWPSPAAFGEPDPRAAAAAIEREFDLRAEMVVFADKRLTVWVALPNIELRLVKVTALSIACLLNSFPACDVIEIGHADTTDLP